MGKSGIDPKKALGRPTLYRKEYCQALIEHMSKGFSFEAFGAFAHVGKRTLFDWVKAHPEFKEAKEIGESYGRLMWEQRGLNLVEYGGGNATAWIFTMRNRFAWRNDPLALKKAVKAEEKRDDTSKLSDEELRARIAAKLAKLPREDA